MAALFKDLLYYTYSLLLRDYSSSIALSLSYLCLCAVLVLYKYEMIFRTAVFAVAALGPLFPPFYGVPYILILWRVFIGLNVSTDQKLFIGRHKSHTGKFTEQNDMDKADFSGSTTLSHWVVVTQDGSSYYYTHAVRGVVFGKGEKKPFKLIELEELLEKYQLSHVGFVTRKQRERKMREVVDFEPMKSGNSCQEYAVDIAFQISSSRTYTFVKIMALPRIRNAIFYSAIVVSITLSLLGYYIARVLNPLFWTNLFAAVELARIGIHNKSQGAYLPVIRAYIQYPTKWNFLQLVLISLSLVYVYVRFGIEACIIMAMVIATIVLMFLNTIDHIQAQQNRITA